jgi:two-component system chemotaxis sensor kinase CheA
LILAQQLEDNPDKNMTDTQVEYASVIRTSGKDLLGLLNNILDLAKVESGTVSIQMETLSVPDLRSTLLREFEQVAVGKDVGYAIDIAPGCPVTIETDPQRLRQILKNLLANAFKFTEHGRVDLQMGVAGSGWSPQTASLVDAPLVVALSVRDTGIGIEDEQQQHIFEAFQQGDGTTSRLYGGTGLGLSISRELVDLLGGEITVTSALGQGSIFTVYLPAGRNAGVIARTPSTALPVGPPVDLPAGEVSTTSTALEPARHVNLDEGPLEGLRVLVVDDDFRNIFAMTALLERGRAAVIIAENGPDAISALEQNPDVDLVLMDIMMPGMDGYAAIRAIRAMEQFTTLPIIAVTGKVVPGERQRCLDAGANDYVPKPVDTVELLTAVGPWLPVSGRSRA